MAKPGSKERVRFLVATICHGNLSDVQQGYALDAHGPEGIVSVIFPFQLSCRIAAKSIYAGFGQYIRIYYCY